MLLNNINTRKISRSYQKRIAGMMEKVKAYDCNFLVLIGDESIKFSGTIFHKYCENGGIVDLPAA